MQTQRISMIVHQSSILIVHQSAMPIDIGGNGGIYCFRCWEIRRLGVSEEILNILQAS
jgi:hypothetical protein